MNNLEIYERVRVCPDNALRKIEAGKLRGKSDINPMWRIKTLTEVFGPCGFGWYTEVIDRWREDGAGGEKTAWVEIHLFVNYGGEWSKPIYGIGGSMIVDTQKGSLSTNDEAFKMAYTDAISVACKALGVAADVYWDCDKTKYSSNTEKQSPQCEGCGNPILPYKTAKGNYITADYQAEGTLKIYGKRLCKNCSTRMKAAPPSPGGTDGNQIP